MTYGSRLNSSINRLKSTGPLRWLAERLPWQVKASLRAALDQVGRPSKLDLLIEQADVSNNLIARMMYEDALASPRFQEPKRLLRHGFKIYSQHDEDGIQEEIFRRIGCTNRMFVEFGVGDGLENNSLYLLLKGWRGAWIEGSASCYSAIERNFRFLTDSGQLRLLRSFITAENIERLFDELELPKEFDLLCIDIDNNDFWVWNAIRKYRPRVVCIEYNASFGRSVKCVVPYEPNKIWDYSNHFGASLKACEELGRDKGYRLVGCNYTGVNAFFVRADLVGDHFAEPFTSENHYEPPRYYVRMPNGHRPRFGPIERLGASDAGRLVEDAASVLPPLKHGSA